MERLEAIIVLNETILGRDQGYGNYIASATEKYLKGDISLSTHRLDKRVMYAIETAIKLGLKAKDFNE